jgi:hypothetical protein
MKLAPTLRNLRGNGAIWRASTKPWKIHRHIQTDPLPEIERSWGLIDDVLTPSRRPGPKPAK